MKISSKKNILNCYNSIIVKIIRISRIKKQIIIIASDLLIVISALFLSFSLKLGYWYWPDENLFWFIILSPLIAIPIFRWFGLYHVVVRFLGFQALWSVFKATFLYALVWGVFVLVFVEEDILRSVILINWLLIVVSVGGLRMFIKLFFYKLNSLSERSRVIIFGAGAAGRQLLTALQQSSELNPIAFIDDDNKLQGKIINDIMVYDRIEVKKLIKDGKVSEVLIAMPSISQNQRNNIVDFLESFPVVVRSVPGVSELAQGRVKISNLSEVSINDLLGRVPVIPDQKLMTENIKGKVVMITGAGGSIGSELCRQVAKLEVDKLILFENNELALYKIDKELNLSIDVYPILGSILDQSVVVR